MAHPLLNDYYIIKALKIGGIKNEKRMKVYRWDEDEFEWVKIPGSTVDTDANTVTAFLDHLSDFNVQDDGVVWSDGYPNVDVDGVVL